MTNKTLILGNHPLAESLVQQYEARGDMVEHLQETSVQDVCINNYDELFFLTSVTETQKEKTDNDSLMLLSLLVMDYDTKLHEDRKLQCHLLVQSQKTLQMLQTSDFCEAIRKKADIYSFSMDEVWSRKILLDYEPITIQSEKHVHLVIFGMDEVAKAVAIQAAHIAHHPNYIRDHSLRTRITMIDEQASQKSKLFIKSYQHLFDNSFYRVVDLGKRDSQSSSTAVTLFHKPIFDGQRQDFVDIEWEFVEAEEWNPDVREKLVLWAKDKKQLLTVVAADQDRNRNINNALHLPDELYQELIPIYIYSQQRVSLNCSNIRFFGMLDSGYDVTLPLVRMAKNVNYIYDRCYEENVAAWKGRLRFSVEIDKAKREESWAKLKNVKRMSSIYNAMTIPVKMRSVGLEEDDWAKFYGITQQDIEMMAQVEHNRWSVEELILGFRPCTDEEERYVEADVKNRKEELKLRKIHYDLRAYNDLRPDGTGKPVQVYDLCLSSCLPLIIKAFSDEKGGEV